MEEGRKELRGGEINKNDVDWKERQSKNDRFNGQHLEWINQIARLLIYICVQWSIESLYNRNNTLKNKILNYFILMSSK